MTRILRTATLALAIGALAGCSTTASINSGEELAKATTNGEKVAFGQFKLVRNGETANLGTGIFDSSVRLHVVNDGSDHDFVGRVGDDGEFNFAIEPGVYRITGVEFDNRGEAVVTDVNFVFSVSPKHEATYIGTITLDASVDFGYYGTQGAVNDYTVTNDCAADCAGRLEALGLSADSMTVALVNESFQLAQTN
jgi:hypothetical protein